MERMTLAVRKVTRDEESASYIAHVVATSARRVSGQPVATINLRLVLPLIAGEHHAARVQRAKDQALRFLDVA
jgi:hypothetical protein